MKLIGDDLHSWQALAVLAGLLTLTAATLVFASCIIGILSFEQFEFSGQSGLRTLAGIAISGCLLTAIGYWDN